jgi:glucosamine--fructose-6-phosphate aminotransferase (isomerizing)
MRSELGEAPEVVRSLVEKHWGVIDAVAEAIRSRPVDIVLMAARGTSDHAAIYAQYIFGVYNRLPVALAAPSIQSLYGVVPRLHRALVIGVSQSGQSPDVVGVLEEARRQNALTIAVTNDVKSPLGRAAEFRIDIHAGPELAVAATKTYVAELTALAMLSTALSDNGLARQQLREVPDAISAALGLEDIVKSAAREEAGMQRAAVLGRGFNYSTALEWSLKLKEMTYVLADAYSTADFEHGPIAMIDPGFVVHAIAADGPTLP